MKNFTIRSEQELNQITQFLLPKIKNGGVVALQGELGAGKTTLTKTLILALGSTDIVTSPTFTILNTYASKEKNTIFHLDLYRLKNVHELENIGFSEIMEDPQNIVVIEWPELAQSELPQHTIWIQLEIVGEHERKITITSKSHNLL